MLRLRLLEYKLLSTQEIIRISFSALLRVVDSDRYLLIRNLYACTIGPIGGVYKYFNEAVPTLDRLEFQPQSYGGRNDRNDIRGFLPLKHLMDFIDWFEKETPERESVNQCLSREVQEEMIEAKVPYNGYPRDIRFRYIRTVTEGPERAVGQHYRQFRHFEIYEMVESQTTREFAYQLFALAHTTPGLLAARPQEIISGRAVGSNELIGNHACYLFSRSRLRPDSRLVPPTTIEDNNGISAAKDRVTQKNDHIISTLFLAADPSDASRLRLGEEFRDILEQLKLAKLRDRFRLELPQLSLRPPDITQALLDTQPQIVHFSGHGAVSGALYIEDPTGKGLLIEPDALATLFEQFACHVNCIILNACYSDAQAKAISKYIDYVIGMDSAIEDRVALAFTRGFYQALGAGCSIEDAYKLGCVQIRLHGFPEHPTPILIKKK